MPQHPRGVPRVLLPLRYSNTLRYFGVAHFPSIRVAINISSVSAPLHPHIYFCYLFFFYRLKNNETDSKAFKRQLSLLLWCCSFFYISLNHGHGIHPTRL